LNCLRNGSERGEWAWSKAFVKFPIAVANYRGKCTENSVPLRALFVRPRQIEYEMKRAFSGKL